jgi:hypothetical protein
MDSKLKNEFLSELKCSYNFENKDSLLKYIEWLEKKAVEPQILKWIKIMFEHAEQRKWFETYWVFDVHGTISVPDYRKGIKKTIDDNPNINYYPFAKETLQLLSERPDTVIIMFTSSYPDEIEYYNKIFQNDNIHFKFINENPDISDSKGAFGFYEKKMYFNVLFDDKAGFNPETDWEPVYNYLKQCKYKPDRSTKLTQSYASSDFLIR